MISVRSKNLSLKYQFKPRLKYGWFHLKLYSMFQDLSYGSIETDFSNSLNSDTGFKDIGMGNFEFVTKTQFPFFLKIVLRNFY